MSKELTALEAFNKIIDLAHEKNGYLNFTNGYDAPYTQIVETALITNKRKLDLIGEILVDVSKGNYADLNDAIDEIREVLS